jgi:hypothetical protein
VRSENSPDAVVKLAIGGQTAKAIVVAQGVELGAPCGRTARCIRLSCAHGFTIRHERQRVMRVARREDPR